MLKNIINKKRLIIAAVVLAVLVVAVLSNSALSGYLGEVSVLQFKIQRGAEYEAVNYGRDILLVNTEGIMAIDRSGHEKWKIVCGSASPAVSVSGDYIMIANLGGRDISLYKADRLMCEIKTEREILSAKLNKNGYVAVATEELGYKGMITVYDKSGTEMFRWHSGKGYISGMSISENNRVAVAQVMTDKEKLYTNMFSIDVKKNGEVTDFVEVEGLIADIVFRDNGSVVAVSDTGLYGFKKSGSKAFEVNFGGRALKSYNINNENNMIFSFDNGRNGTLIESYSSGGELRGSYDAESEVRNIDVNGECIVLGTADRILRVNPAGKLKKEIELSRDVKGIKVFGGRDRVIVIGGNSAEILKM